MSLFSADILYEIFLYHKDDLKTLYSILLVNKLWCETVVPILWNNPWKECSKRSDTNLCLIRTLYCCLSEESKLLLSNKKIKFLFDIRTLKSTIFNYPQFIQYLDFIYLKNQISSIGGVKEDIQIFTEMLVSRINIIKGFRFRDLDEIFLNSSGENNDQIQLNFDELKIWYSFFYIHKLSKEQIENLKNVKLPKLEYLEFITYCSSSLGIIIKMIENTNGKLRHLCFHFCFEGENLPLLYKTIIQTCPNIEWLTLCSCSSKEKLNLLEQVLNTCKQLKGLKLFSNDSNGDEILKIIGQVAPATLCELSLDVHFFISAEDFTDFCETWKNRNALVPLAFDLFLFGDENEEVEEIIYELGPKYVGEGVLRCCYIYEGPRNFELSPMTWKTKYWC